MFILIFFFPLSRQYLPWRWKKRGENSTSCWIRVWGAGRGISCIANCLQAAGCVYRLNREVDTRWADGKESISDPSHAKYPGWGVVTLRAASFSPLRRGIEGWIVFIKRTFLSVTLTAHKTTDQLLGSRHWVGTLGNWKQSQRVHTSEGNSCQRTNAKLDCFPPTEEATERHVTLGGPDCFQSHRSLSVFKCLGLTARRGRCWAPPAQLRGAPHSRALSGDTSCP